MDSSRTILVIGGAGYVGSALVPRLLEEGCRVAVADAAWFGWSLPESVQRVEKELFSFTEEDLSGFDAVIFLAGLSNDPMAEFSPALNFVHNASAPTYLGYLAARAGVPRMIFAGSCSVYGYAADRLYDETMPTRSDFPYGIAKLQAEQALLRFARPDFSVISLRKGTVSGYSPRMRLDLMINAMYRSACEEGRIRVSHPDIWRPVLGIEDAVEAYLCALSAPRELSGPFNVASGNYTVLEVATAVQEDVARHLGRPVALEIQNNEDKRNYRVSCEQAETCLGFRPRADVSSIVEDLHRHRAHFSDWSNPAYINIEVFRARMKAGHLTTGMGGAA